MKPTNEEIERYTEGLRVRLPPGTTVHTNLRHVSASGMSRCIDVRLFKADSTQPNGVAVHWLSYWVAHVCGYRFDDKTDSVRVGGCGMDMGFAIVYALSRKLYPKGFDCIGKGCPSNDHHNHGDENNKHHADGGYALRHAWF